MDEPLLEEAEDSDSPQAAIIDLILAQHASRSGPQEAADPSKPGTPVEARAPDFGQDTNAMRARLLGAAATERKPRQPERDLAGWLAARGDSELLPAIESAMVNARVPTEARVPLLSGMGEAELSEFLGSCAAEATTIRQDQPKLEPQPAAPEPEPQLQPS